MRVFRNVNLPLVDVGVGEGLDEQNGRAVVRASTQNKACGRLEGGVADERDLFSREVNNKTRHVS